MNDEEKNPQPSTDLFADDEPNDDDDDEQQQIVSPN